MVVKLRMRPQGSCKQLRLGLSQTFTRKIIITVTFTDEIDWFCDQQLSLVYSLKWWRTKHEEHQLDELSSESIHPLSQGISVWSLHVLKYMIGHAPGAHAHSTQKDAPLDSGQVRWWVGFLQVLDFIWVSKVKQPSVVIQISIFQRVSILACFFCVPFATHPLGHLLRTNPPAVEAAALMRWHDHNYKQKRRRGNVVDVILPGREFPLKSWAGNTHNGTDLTKEQKSQTPLRDVHTVKNRKSRCGGLSGKWVTVRAFACTFT